jgi:hypothetical protein
MEENKLISNQKIEIKFLSNHILHGFMRCPYKFYWQNIKGKGVDHVDWRELVQYVVNKVITQFYQLPLEQRSAFQILKLVETHWRLEVKWFHSKAHYYKVVAQITDHLIQCLNRSEGLNPPLFLYEKYNIKSKELQTNLSMTLQVGEWGKESFTIKKYLVDGNEDIIQLYKNFTIVFTHQAFSRLPESIEIVSLITGKTYLFHPTMDDLQESSEYVRSFKELLEDPKNYIKIDKREECNQCPFSQDCNPLHKVRHLPH